MTLDTQDASVLTAPVFSRRAFIAAALSALTAGGVVALLTLGAVTQPDTASFRFSRGVIMAADVQDQARGFLSKALHDDRIRVTIVGHTGEAGDPAANLKLSIARAEKLGALARDMGILPEQIITTGVGGSAPVPRNDGEGARAYQARLARVETTLQMRR